MSTPKEQRPAIGATPRTDALDCCEVFDKNGQPYAAMLVPSNFARELERELAVERAVKAELVAALEQQTMSTAQFDGKPTHMWEYYLTDTARAALDRAKEASK